MVYPLLFGVLLTAAGGSAVAAGVFVLQINKKATANRLMMVICSALTCWSLGLAVTASAKSIDTALLGHMIAPLGWGTMPGLLLHLALVLAEKNTLLKKRWIYPALYLPGLLQIIAFIVLPLLGLNKDVLVSTPLGWAPGVHRDGWDYIFYGYYIVYTIINLTVLTSHMRRAVNLEARRQAARIVVGLTVGYILGTLSDIAPGFIGLSLPQFATIFTFIPISVLISCIRRNGFMVAPDRNSNGTILHDSARVKVYWIISAIALFGSIWNILGECYRRNASLQVKSILSFFLLFIVAFIVFINRSRMREERKELYIAVTISVVVPSLTIWFTYFGSNELWVIVFPLLTACLLFNRRLLLVTTTVAAVATQLLLLTSGIGQANGSFDYAYTVQTVFIAIASAVSFFVNNVYVRKLRENQAHVDKQILIADVSRAIVSVGELNMDDKMQEMLRQCVNFLRCDRAYVVLFEENAQDVRYLCQWSADRSPCEMSDFKKLIADLYPIMCRQFESEQIIKLSDTRFLPHLTEKDKRPLAENNILGLVSVPIRTQGRIEGVLGFSAARPLREWNLNSTEFLEIISNTVSDAVTRIETEKKVSYLAYHDHLTKLPNRARFKEQLEQAIELAARTEKMIGVIFLDLDAFKSINDTMGHALGDLLLYNVAQMLKQSLRRYDVVARFGGDEFVIMLSQIPGVQEALTIMDKLMRAIKKPVLLQGQEFFITASAGISVYPQDGQDAEMLIKNADTAMYHAKSLGKNRYSLCSQELKERVLERMNLSNSLYRALEKEQLILYYQPQVNITTNTIVGLEALLRWVLPDKGMISPAVFIPLAEQTGLINPIGEWVLETACRQNRLWQDKGLSVLRMAVNISVHQLRNPSFPGVIARILEKTGIPPHTLELEITESVASNNLDNIINIIQSLKNMGVSISIDDFGTEYSSLSRLKQLPVDRIKMDMQFVQGIDENEKDQAITKVIINLAKNMKLKVIAEGVETKSQLDFLSQRMCDEVQGFYYYKPMPAEEIEKILAIMK